MHNSAPCITVSGVSHYYDPGKNVLSAVSLTLNQGESLGLLGVNGAGKSTLISLMTGQQTLQTGQIELAGDNFKQHRDSLLKKIALVPQGYAFYPKLTVGENLAFFAKLRTDLNNTKQRIQDALAFCQLESQVNQLSMRLSGGFKRRLNLAIGVLNRPDILFLDEPTAGIDPLSRNFILDAIQRLQKTGMSMIYTSHHLVEVEQLCSHLALLHEGRIAYQGSTAQLQATQGIVFEIVFESDIPQTFEGFIQKYALKRHNNTLKAQFPLNFDLQSFNTVLFAELNAHPRLKVQKLLLEPLSLETTFLRLTG